MSGWDSTYGRFRTVVLCLEWPFHTRASSAPYSLSHLVSISPKLSYAPIMQCWFLTNQRTKCTKFVKFLTLKINYPIESRKDESFSWKHSKSAIFKGKKIINLSPWAKLEHLQTALKMQFKQPKRKKASLCKIQMIVPTKRKWEIQVSFQTWTNLASVPRRMGTGYYAWLSWP
jgi:hypothetical protein